MRFAGLKFNYYTSRGGFAVGADLGRRPGEGPRRVSSKNRWVWGCIMRGFPKVPMIYSTRKSVRGVPDTNCHLCLKKMVSNIC